jgi:glyoxylase-like metal-dependent hydrolase (beta-lactamase superfamily II)
MSAHPQVQTLFDERTSTLTHVVFDAQTRDAVVIDPVLDYEPAGGKLWTESLERLAAFVAEQGLKVHYALETHAHADHLSGGQWLKSRFGAPVAIGRGITGVQQVFSQVFELGPDFPTDGRQFDRLLADGEVLEAGSLRVEVLSTPGHTPGCVSFVVGDAVFTGDALFLDDVGVARCDFPNGDPALLHQSITTRLWTLPSETRVYPGHDYPPAGRTWQASTTIGESRRRNVHLNEELSKETFVERRSARDRTLAPPRLLFPSVQVNIDAGRLPAPSASGRRFLRIPLRGP